MAQVTETFKRLPLATDVEGSLDFVFSSGCGISHLTSVKGREVTRIWLSTDALLKLKAKLVEVFGA